MTFHFQDNEGVLQEAPIAFFQQITGVQWTDDIIVSEHSLHSPFTISSTDRQLMELLLPKYREFKKSPPSLFIRLGAGPGRHSVHALKKIPKGSVVLEYKGEWTPLAKKSSPYRWGPIDALNYRNYGGLVEDGFPNVGAFHLYDVEGIPLRILFIALEDIEAEEILTINYGMNHSVKMSYHHEYRLDQMTSFFSDNSIEQIYNHIHALKVFSPLELVWDRTIELENLTTKIRYLYHTPGALFLLLNKKILQKSDVFQFFNEAEFRYFFINFPFNPNKREKEIIDALSLIQSYDFDLLPIENSCELLYSIRHRIFFSLFLPALANNEDFNSTYQEAITWNEAFGALEEQDFSLFKLPFAQAKKQEALIEACLAYAHGSSSLFASWLEEQRTL